MASTALRCSSVNPDTLDKSKWAERRVLDNSVLKTVLRIALIDDGLLQLFEGLPVKRGLIEMVRVRIKHLLDRHRLRGHARPIKRGRAGNDPVEILREALRLHHRLASAARATGEVAEGGV